MSISRRSLFPCLCALILSGCSVFGQTGVDVAPYKVLEKVRNIEVRHYERLVLVSTAMPSGMEEQRSPFRKLFDYISGNNDVMKEIPMTAPVLIEQQNDSAKSMSFVLPDFYSFETVPIPKDPAVQVDELVDYTVAAITFSGSFEQDSIHTHTQILEQWIAQHGLIKKGPVIAAGYNPPFTLPAFRRNEVLIPIVKP